MDPDRPRFRVRYWPCFGAWPFLIALMLSVPVALWAQRDAASPSTIQCSSAFLAGAVRRIDARCTVKDPHGVSWETLPCDAVLPALDGLLGAYNPLHRLRITATAFGFDGTLTDDAFVVPGDAASGVDAAGARRLLGACTEGEAKPASSRTVLIMVLDRDYEPSALVVCAFLGIALILCLRRRAAVDIDPTEGVLVVVERGFLREQRTVIVPTRDVADVRVETGLDGSLSGRRVELVRHDGVRVPVTEAYEPMTYAVHDQAARRLRAYLGGPRTAREF